jgi:adenine-specific DNA-methyltransferase
VKELYKLFSENEKNYKLIYNKDYRKRYSQYFTDFDYSKKLVLSVGKDIYKKNNLNILEPAAGTGNLILSLLLNLRNSCVKKVRIDMYEIDANLIPILTSNISKLKDRLKNEIKINFNIINKDFLKQEIKEKYDIILSNPPYKKIRKTEISNNSTYINFFIGQPNIYHLFLIKNLDLLKDDGYCVFLSPKSYFSGKYSEKIRNYIIDNYNIYKIYSFDERKKIFNNEIQQEIIITSFTKRKLNDTIIEYNNNGVYCVKQKNIISEKNKKSIILVPRNKKEFETIKKIEKSFKFNLGDLGFKIKVGQNVIFRAKNKYKLFTVPYKKNKTIPLIRSRHFSKNGLNYSNNIKGKNRYISMENKGVREYAVKNDNYLLFKRLVTKNNKKIFNVIPYFKNFFDSKYISFENNFVYIHKKNFMIEELYGLYFLFNSYLYDLYYRAINSTHGLNIYELESMKFPSINIIREIGNLYLVNNISEEEIYNFINTLIQ